MPYGRKCQSGDVVKIRVNCTLGTIEFFINGQSQGVAFGNLVMPVIPALSLHGENTTQLRFTHELFSATTLLTRPRPESICHSNNHYDSAVQ